MRNAQMDTAALDRMRLKLQNLWAIARERTRMMDEPFKAQKLQERQRLLHIADHLRRVEDVAHAVELDPLQRRMQPLHDGHDNAIVLNIETLTGLYFTKLPSDRRHQLPPAVLLQKCPRPLAIPGPHIHIEEAAGSGDGTIHRAKGRHIGGHGQQQHLTGLSGCHAASQRTGSLDPPER